MVRPANQSLQVPKQKPRGRASGLSIKKGNGENERMTSRFTLTLANKIKDAIWKYQEEFHPNIFENIFIVGGIAERGYSSHDIDIVILWNFECVESETELEHIKQIIQHLVNFWLKSYDFPIENIDIYNYVRYGSYNLEYGGWHQRTILNR